MIDETKFVQVVAITVVSVGLIVGVLLIAYLDGGF